MNLLVILTVFFMSSREWPSSPAFISAAIDSDYPRAADNVMITVTFHTTPRTIWGAWSVCSKEYGGKLLSSYVQEYSLYVQQQFWGMMSKPDFLTRIQGEYFWVNLRSSLADRVISNDGRSSYPDLVCEVIMINGTGNNTVRCDEHHLFACEKIERTSCPYEKHPDAILVTEPGIMEAISEQQCQDVCDSSADCWAYGHSSTEVPVCELYKSDPQTNITLKHVNGCSVFVKTCVKGYIVTEGSTIWLISHSINWMNSSTNSGLQTGLFSALESNVDETKRLTHLSSSISSPKLYVSNVPSSTPAFDIGAFSTISFITSYYEYDFIPPSSYLRVIPDDVPSVFTDSVAHTFVSESGFPYSNAPESGSILPSAMNEGKSPSSLVYPSPENKPCTSNMDIIATHSTEANPSGNDNILQPRLDDTVLVYQPSVTSVSSSPTLESIIDFLNSLSESTIVCLDVTSSEVPLSRSHVYYNSMKAVSAEVILSEKTLVPHKSVNAPSTGSPFHGSYQTMYGPTDTTTIHAFLSGMSQMTHTPIKSFISQTPSTSDSSSDLVPETITDVTSTSIHEDVHNSVISLRTVDFTTEMNSLNSILTFVEFRAKSEFYHQASQAYTLVSSSLGLCPCPCALSATSTSSMTKEEKSAMVNKIIASLTLNKTQIGATQRKYVSAVDDRPFSRSAGSIGIAILVLVFLSVLMLDLISVLQIVAPFRPMEQHE